MTSPRFSLLANATLFLALASLINKSVAQPATTGFVIGDVSVFDGERIRPHSNVVIEGGIIRAVDSKLPKRWQKLPVIPGIGATLLPWFIDAHSHTILLAQLQNDLRFGVTTILDMWTPSGERTFREAAATRLDVSDFRSAGILATVPGGHGTEYGIKIPTVSGPSAADAFVATRKSEGADYLKIVLNGVRAKRGSPTMDAATARALVQAGHERGMLVLAHIENLEMFVSRLTAVSMGWRIRGEREAQRRMSRSG